MNAVKEFTPAGGNRRLYLYNASNERVATIELLSGGQQQSDWTIRDDAGKILRRYKKHPNGAWSWEEDYIYRGSQLLAAEVPGSELAQFTGHERDNFQLDYMHARYYDPMLGRFLAPDPASDADLRTAKGWNRYSYVRNNPVNQTDPTGRWFCRGKRSTIGPTSNPRRRGRMRHFHSSMPRVEYRY